jgi:hypothetical protein
VINKKVKKSTIVFAILYLVIGLADLIGGASSDSSFYIFDDILVRFIGLTLVISCLALFFKKSSGRKGVIVALIMSILEIFIGIPKDMSLVEIIIGVIIMLIAYVPGLVYVVAYMNRIERHVETDQD